MGLFQKGVSFLKNPTQQRSGSLVNLSVCARGYAQVPHYNFPNYQLKVVRRLLFSTIQMAMPFSLIAAVGGCPIARVKTAQGQTPHSELHKVGSARDSEAQTSYIKCSIVCTGDIKGKIVYKEGLYIKVADAYLMLCLGRAWGWHALPCSPQVIFLQAVKQKCVWPGTEGYIHSQNHWVSKRYFT